MVLGVERMCSVPTRSDQIHGEFSQTVIDLLRLEDALLQAINARADAYHLEVSLALLQRQAAVCESTIGTTEFVKLFHTSLLGYNRKFEVLLTRIESPSHVKENRG